MADPLSVTSALIGLVAFSYQASRGLRDTIRSYSQHPKHVRDLEEELSSLEDVLLLLEQTLTTSGEADLAALESPIQRCGRACREFEQALQKCTKRNHADGSSFRSWLKIRWMGSDINGFKNTLAVYKSTIAIAMAGADLRTSKASLDVIQEYKEMIQCTTTDLNDHFCDIDNKLREVSLERYLPDDPMDENSMLSERESTLRCLEICVQVSNFIKDRHKSIVGNLDDYTATADQAESGADSSSARQIVDDSLQSCRLNIKSATAQLSTRLQYLSTTLSSESPDILQTPANGVDERDRMVKEIESVRQYIDICTRAGEDAGKAHCNVMEDIAIAEDSRQVLVSTIGDLIAAHRITAGARSLQAIGQMSDKTLQQMSRTHGVPSAAPAGLATESHQGQDSHAGLGRTLGSSNIRTL